MWFPRFTNNWSSGLILLKNGHRDAEIYKHPNAKTEIGLLCEEDSCIICLLHEQNNCNIVANRDPLYVMDIVMRFAHHEKNSVSSMLVSFVLYM